MSKSQAKVSIIIPNPKLYQSPQYSKKHNCLPFAHGLPPRTHENLQEPQEPLRAPETARKLTHSSQRIIDAVGITFSWWNCPLSASELSPRAPERKYYEVDITFLWWNCPCLPLSCSRELSYSSQRKKDAVDITASMTFLGASRN